MQDMHTPTPTPEAQLRSTQVAIIALTLGVAIFAPVAGFLAPQGEPFPPVLWGLDALALTAITLTVTMSFAAFFVPGRMVDTMRGLSPDRRVHAFCASRVVAAALCEGPALLWCVALLLSGTWWYLAPITLLVGLLVLQIPTHDSFEAGTGVRLSDS